MSVTMGQGLVLWIVVFLPIASHVLRLADGSVDPRHKRQSEQCPVPGDQNWNVKERNCLEGQVYHCLQSYEAHIVADGCYVPQECLKGAIPVLEDLSIKCRRCPQGTFQPWDGLKSNRTVDSFCDPHNPCKKEYGKKQCRSGTAEHDIGCMCNPSQGYSPLESNCKCFSANDGCTCIFNGCPNGTIRNDYGMCVSEPVSLMPTTPAPQTSQTTPMPTASDRLPDVAIALIVVVIIIAAIAVAGIVGYKQRGLPNWCSCWRKETLIPSPPSAPVGPVRVTLIQPNSATLSWSPPSNGGTLVQYYIVERSDNGQMWCRLDQVDAVRTLYKAQELIQGHTYRFRVTSFNDIGESEPLESDTVVLADRPSPPEGPILVTNVTADSATLTWKPPQSDGGSSLHGYIVEKREVHRNVWTDVDTVDAETLCCKVNGLVEGMTYIFCVTARNEHGSSIPLESSEVSAKRPPEVPFEPAGPLQCRMVLPDSVVLTWSPPSNDGGMPIINYVVELCEVDSSNWQVASTNVSTTRHKVEGLIKGSAYKFRVRAVNDVGQGEPLESGEPLELIDPADRPSPPQGPVLISGITENSVVLTWKPPNGGPSISDYIIEKRELRRDVWTEVSTVENEMLTVKVNGLTAGTVFIFRIMAKNGRGISLPLESGPVMPKKPAVVPDEPLGPIKFLQVTSSSINLSWSPPLKDGGSPVTSYTVELTDDDGKTWQQVDAAGIHGTFYTVHGLAEDQNYKFRVKAHNEIGPSKPLESTTQRTKKNTSDKGRITIIHNHNPKYTINEPEVVFMGDTITVGQLPRTRSAPREIEGHESLFGPEAVDNQSLLDPEETSPKTLHQPQSEETHPKSAWHSELEKNGDQVYCQPEEDDPAVSLLGRG